MTKIRTTLIVVLALLCVTVTAVDAGSNFHKSTGSKKSLHTCLHEHEQMPDFIILGGEEVEVWMFNFFYQMEVRGKKKTNNIYTLESLTVTLWPLPEYIAQTTQPIDIGHIPVPVTFEGRANNYTRIKIDKISGHKAGANHQFPEQFEIARSQLEGVTDTAGQGGEGYSCTYRFPQNFEVFPNFPLTLSLRVAQEKALGCNKTFHWQPFKGASGPSLGNWENDWEGIVTGYVYDAETLEPLTDFPVHARVPIVDKSENARTDNNGKYQIAIDLHELKKDCIDDLYIHAGEYYDQANTTQGYKEEGKGKLSICKGNFTPYSFYLEPISTQEEQGEVPSPPPAEEPSQPQEEPQMAEITTTLYPDLVVQKKGIPPNTSTIICGIEPIQSSSHTIGKKSKIWASIYNTGTKDAENVTVVIYREDEKFEEFSISKIEKGNYKHIEAYWTPKKRGKVTFTIKADPRNIIEEINESNNSVTLEAEVKPADYDWAILSIKHIPDSINAGDTVNFYIDVLNKGSRNLTVPLDVYIDNKKLKRLTINTPSGQTEKFGDGSPRGDDIIWQATPGRHTIKAVITTGRYSDNSPSDNSASKVVNVQFDFKPTTGVDFVLRKEDVDFDGGKWKVRVYNRGDKKEIAHLQFKIYYVQGKTIRSEVITTQSSWIPATGYHDFILRASADDFKMELTVDPYNNVLETDESNNVVNYVYGNFNEKAEQIKENREVQGKTALKIEGYMGLDKPLTLNETREIGVFFKNTSGITLKNITIKLLVENRDKLNNYLSKYGVAGTSHTWPSIVNEGEFMVTMPYKAVYPGNFKLSVDASMEVKDFSKRITGHRTFKVVSEDEYPGEEVVPAGVDLDLAATDIWIDNKTPNVGEVISGGFVVHNYSSIALKNIEWKVYSDADVVAAGTITEIGAGASYTVNASSRADQEGTFTIKAIVDPNNKIPETNENNNAVTKKLTITSESQPISLPKVDVAVISVSLSKSHIKVGQDTEVKAVIQNLGSDTINAVPVAFLVGDLNFSIQVIDSLAPGESKTVTAPLVGLMGGSYTITVIADRRELIKEINEQNNRGTTTLVVERLLKWQ